MSLTIWQLDPAQLTPYYNIAVCEALASAGNTVRYITTPFIYDKNLPVSSNFETDYSYFRGLDRQWLLDLPRLRRVLRAISYPFGHLHVLREADRIRPDIVHIQWSRLPFFDLQLMRRLHGLHIPIVHTVHDVVPLFADDEKSDALGQIYTTADRLIVHSQANREDLLAQHPPIAPERVKIMSMVEFDQRETPPDADKASARTQLGLPADKPIVLFFGSIRHYKGVDILLEAFKIAQAKQPDLHLVIAGRADPLERAKLPALETLDQHPNIHLHERFIPHEDLWLYFTAADVIVHPYRHIYQSAALITAMSFGRAVIVTDVGGMPEVIDGNGWIVPREDINALAETLNQAARDPQRLTDMGKRSSMLIEQNHSRGVVAGQLLTVYDELIQEKKAALAQQ